jgi:hypothetical protein
MRSRRVVRASDSQCRSRNCSGFDPIIFRHNGISGAAGETVLNIGHKMKKTKKITLYTYKKKTVIPTKWYLTAAGSEAVEPQLGEEDINSMTIEELRDFINKGVAPPALQSGESNTDLVRFRKGPMQNSKILPVQ